MKKYTTMLLILLLITLMACGTKEVKEEVEPVEVVELMLIREIDDLAYYQGELFTGRGETFEFGNIYEIIEYKNGLKDGTARLYRPGHRENDKKVEKILKESRYKEGRLLESKSWYQDGEKKEEILLDNGNGIGKEYYQDGKLKWEGKYIDGRLEGEKKYYYPSGNLYMIERYKNGKKDGVRESYYESGENKYIGKYENGELVEAEGWYINGVIALEKKGNIVIEYDIDGKKKITTDLEKKIRTTHYDKRDEEEYLYAYDLNLRERDGGEYLLSKYKYNELGKLTEDITYSYRIDTKKIIDLKKIYEKIIYDEFGRVIYKNDKKYEYDGMGNRIGEYNLHDTGKDLEYYSKTGYVRKYKFDEKGNKTWIDYYDSEDNRLLESYGLTFKDREIQILPGYRYEFEEGSKNYDYYRRYNGRIVEYGKMRYDEQERLVLEEVYEGNIKEKPTKNQLLKANYYEYKYENGKEVEWRKYTIENWKFKEKIKKIKEYDENGRIAKETTFWNNEDNEDYVYRSIYEYGYNEEDLW